MQVFQIICLSFHVYICSLVTATKNETHHILPPVTFEANGKKKKPNQPFCIKSVIKTRKFYFSLAQHPVLALLGLTGPCVCALLQHTEKVMDKVLNTVFWDTAPRVLTGWEKLILRPQRPKFDAAIAMCFLSVFYGKKSLFFTSLRFFLWKNLVRGNKNIN